MRSLDPPPALVAGVLRRAARDRVDPLHLWGPLAVELGLVLVTLWYLSGLQGLLALARRTVADVGAVASWGAGQADLPAPPAGDLILLVLCGLLLATTLYHLALLSRRGSAATA